MLAVVKAELSTDRLGVSLLTDGLTWQHSAENSRPQKQWGMAPVHLF